MAHNAIGERIVAEAEQLYNQKHRHCLRVAIDFKCGYELAINDPVQLYNVYIGDSGPSVSLEDGPVVSVILGQQL